MQFMRIGVAEVTARNEKKIFSQKSGEQIGKQSRLAAVFERGIPGWAVPLALEKWPTAPASKPETMRLELYFSWFDSERAQQQHGWTDDERELVERKLLSKATIVSVEPPKVPAPYAKYDQHRKIKGQRTVEHAIKDILAVYDTAGFDVGEALAYERQNLNDPAVIAALEALVEPEVVEEELVAK